MNGDWIEIKTPYLDIFNERIQIYKKVLGSMSVFSDGGATINQLKAHGVNITVDVLMRIRETIEPYKMYLNGSELLASAFVLHVEPRKESFVQAILEIEWIFFNEEGKAK